MKKFLIIFLIMILCVTGCSSVVEDGKNESTNDDYSYNN